MIGRTVSLAVFALICAGVAGHYAGRAIADYLAHPR